MKTYKNMTPIELNVLIIKTKEEQETIKSEIFNYLDEINSIEEKINTKLDNLKKVEDKYVELISNLMEKQ